MFQQLCLLFRTSHLVTILGYHKKRSDPKEEKSMNSSVWSGKIKDFAFSIMFSSSLSSRSIIIMILLAKLKISLVCPTNLAFATNLKQFYIDRQRQRKKESEQKKNLTLVGKSWILNCLIIMLECWSNKIFSLLIIQLLFFLLLLLFIRFQKKKLSSSIKQHQAFALREFALRCAALWNLSLAINKILFIFFCYSTQ